MSTVHAEDFSGADAGIKIAAAIAALPPGVGGTVDATTLTSPRNLTGFTITPGVTVELAPGFYTMPTDSPSIRILQGGRLLGSGSNNPGSTHIKASTNFNKPLVICQSSAGPNGWFHGGLVQDLWLDGNKANQTSGNVLEVYGLAERSMLQRLTISDAKQSGLYIFGSQSGTGSMQNITINNCGLYGVQIDQFRSALTLMCVGGDANPVTFGITNPITGGGSILLIDPKSEAAGMNDPGITPVIKLTGGSARITLTILGGNSICSSNTLKSFIEIAQDVAVNPSIQIIGHASGNMPIIIDDKKNAQQVKSSPNTYHSMFAYTDGHITLDTNGFSIATT